MSKSKLFKIFTLQGLLLVLMAFTFQDNLPKGWFKAGNKPNSYKMGLEKTNFKKEKTIRAAYIKSRFKKIEGFGTLMTNSSAKNYLGKRIEMTGYLKSENVNGWTGLWLRIDNKDGEILRFENMRNRPIKGTNEWAEYKIVFDVPQNSSSLSFGVLLYGTGQVWFDELKIKTVANTTPILEKNK